MKKAIVTPIFKTGGMDRVANYRPISLTCICSKLFEHLITKNIITHLEHHTLLFPLQHGFRELRSCESQLIDFVNDFICNSRAKQTNVIIMDFWKSSSLQVGELWHQGRCSFVGQGLPRKSATVCV